MLHITLAQINPIVGGLDYNRRKILDICDSVPDVTDLIIFPEMALCGYPPEDMVLKPCFMADLKKLLHDILAETKNKTFTIIIPTPWKDDNALYNAALVIEKGEIIDVIFKHHLPNYGVFDEKRLFEAGSLPKPVTIKGHKVGLMICEDMWFSNVSKNLKDHGAEILISVNASPYELEKHDQRLEQAKNRCAETGLPLICVNQCGGQDELVFDGRSFAMNETGQLILQADIFAEDIQHMIWKKSQNGHWFCETKDITPTHNQTEIIYQALMIGLRDYVTKNGFSGVLIGLSGGIDSALSAAIAVDALGPEAVHCVMMPSEYTSQESLDDAALCAKKLGVQLDNIFINDAVHAFSNTLAPHLTKDTPETTHENIQSRCRGLILMALSNATGKMVLSTGNKSEMAVGYATLYGDMCGGFNALKDIYKTKVYELSEWRNKNKPNHALGPNDIVIPENIITKAPSAELKPDQTDQDSLPPYDALDDILECLIEHDMGMQDITKRGHNTDLVQKISHLLDRAEYKRRQAPPGTKITSRSFGRDRRYPVTNHYKSL